MLRISVEAFLNRLIVSRLWPWPSRAVMIGFLLVLTYFSLFGPRDPRLNLATVFSWIVWWPLLAASYFFFGRIWCAVCPMGALDWRVCHGVGDGDPRQSRELR